MGHRESEHSAGRNYDVTQLLPRTAGAERSAGPRREEGFGNLVSALRREGATVVQVAEHVRTSTVVGLVRQTRNDVHVKVSEPFRLGEQHHVGLLAASDGLQRDRSLPQEITECDRLIGGQLIQRMNMPERRQDEPTLEARVEVMCHAPAGLPDEPLSERGVRTGLLAGVARA